MESNHSVGFLKQIWAKVDRNARKWQSHLSSRSVVFVQGLHCRIRRTESQRTAAWWQNRQECWPYRHW